MRTALLAITGLAALSALVGCATLPGGSIRETLPVSFTGCNAAMPWLSADPTPAPVPTEQPIPADFAPSDVIQCTEGTMDDDAGRWQTIVATHYGGDYTALLAALAEPDDQPPAGQSLICPAIGYVVPPLWLVNADGAILVHHPLEVCGKPKADVDDALAKLTVTGTEATPMRLVPPKATIDSGCDAGWKYLPPSTMADGNTTATAWTDAASTLPAPPCDAAPTEFGILSTPAADDASAFHWVELDGCRRAYTQDCTARSATPALLALFG